MSRAIERRTTVFGRCVFNSQQGNSRKKMMMSPAGVRARKTALAVPRQSTLHQQTLTN